MCIVQAFDKGDDVIFAMCQLEEMSMRQHTFNDLILSSLSLTCDTREHV